MRHVWSLCVYVSAILTFEPVDFHEILYEHYAISAYSNTMCFQFHTVWNKNMAHTQTCEVGSRLYELQLGKAQLRPFANSIQANQIQRFVITLEENPTLSVVPLPLYRDSKKWWKQIFCMGLLVANHILFTTSSVDSDVYLILVGKWFYEFHSDLLVWICTGANDDQCIIN